MLWEFWRNVTVLVLDPTLFTSCWFIKDRAFLSFCTLLKRSNVQGTWYSDTFPDQKPSTRVLPDLRNLRKQKRNWAIKATQLTQQQLKKRRRDSAMGRKIDNRHRVCVPKKNEREREWARVQDTRRAIVPPRSRSRTCEQQTLETSESAAELLSYLLCCVRRLFVSFVIMRVRFCARDR